jgi:hypothetical protein
VACRRVKPMDARHSFSACRAGIILPLLLVFATPALGSSDPATLCDAAAVAAATDSGVPVDVLRALTRTETGRASGGALRPWPWAINQAGEGSWFATEDDMMAHVDGLTSAGITNFDVGCFQLNYRWHGNGFASLPDMVDPDQNARYAARFLAQKFAATGDWALAAAAYHSATPAHAIRYLARFSEIYAALDPQQAAPAFVVAEPDQPNLFPLLIVGRSGGGGSLVPMTATGRRLFGGDN